MAMDLNAGLLGHWPLRGECRDHSGQDWHGRNLGADLAAPGPDGRPGGAAGFDGRGAHVEIDGVVDRLGTDDLTLAAWVWTAPDEAVDDPLGDLASAYDPASRRGFTLGLLTYTGVTSHQPNWRTLHWGIDDGTALPPWVDCGRPGHAVFVKALAVHEGGLYAATFEPGAGERGHVYRWRGGTEWEDCGAPDQCNMVASLAVYQGALYAGVSRYKAQGSALADSPNDHPGGRIYRYLGGQAWAPCGRLDEGDVLARAGADGSSPYRSPVCDSVAGLAVLRGRLYAIPLYSEGLFRYHGGTTWTSCGTPGRRLMALAAYRGALYAAANENGGVYRYDGGVAGEARWTWLGQPPGVSQVYSFAVYGGQLHAGTWPEGRVFRYDGGTAEAARWVDCGRLGQEREVMGMVPYNGKLYAGTLPLAEVYRYDPTTNADEAWTRTGRLDWTPDVTYRRAWSMAVYRGRLFCGTLPSGHVYSLAAGHNVTYDAGLPPGWHHLAAVRAGGRLILYLDGQSIAESTQPTPLDIAPGVPLHLGSGPHDAFCGRLSDVRLYRRALTGAEVAALSPPAY